MYLKSYLKKNFEPVVVCLPIISPIVRGAVSPGAVVVVVVVAVVVVVVMVVMVTTTVQWSICNPAPRSQDFLTGSRLGPAELFITHSTIWGVGGEG